MNISFNKEFFLSTATQTAQAALGAAVISLAVPSAGVTIPAVVLASTVNRFSTFLLLKCFNELHEKMKTMEQPRQFTFDSRTDDLIEIPLDPKTMEMLNIKRTVRWDALVTLSILTGAYLAKKTVEYNGCVTNSFLLFSISNLVGKAVFNGGQFIATFARNPHFSKEINSESVRNFAATVISNSTSIGIGAGLISLAFPSSVVSVPSMIFLNVIRELVLKTIQMSVMSSTDDQVENMQKVLYSNITAYKLASYLTEKSGFSLNSTGISVASFVFGQFIIRKIDVQTNKLFTKMIGNRLSL